MDALVLVLKHVMLVKKAFAMHVHQKAQPIFVLVLVLGWFTAHHVFRKHLNAQRKDATRYTVETVSCVMILKER